MKLKDIAAISGKPGLYRIMKPTRTGVIVESIDEKKNKIVANVNYRVSVLKEISIYTTSKEGSIPLADVLTAIKEKYGDNIGGERNNNELISFISELVPDYDTERVYPSDVKKIISWYKILNTFMPQVFTETDEEEVTTEKTDETQEEKK